MFLALIYGLGATCVKINMSALRCQGRCGDSRVVQAVRRMLIVFSRHGPAEVTHLDVGAAYRSAKAKVGRVTPNALSRYYCQRLKQCGLGEFEPVAPGIRGVKSARGFQDFIPGTLDPGGLQSVAQRFDIEYRERGMGLDGRVKRIFYSDVKLTAADLEPAAAARSQRLWFFDFGEAQESAEKSAGFVFTAFGRGDLNVIDVQNPARTLLHTRSCTHA